MDGRDVKRCPRCDPPPTLTNPQTKHTQGPDSRVSLSAVEAAITPSTFLLVGSAPQYPHGVVRGY